MEDYNILFYYIVVSSANLWSLIEVIEGAAFGV